MSFSQEELERYSRQIVLKEIGFEGQVKLKHSRVSVIGVGGLGCFSAIQLVSMGVGYLRLVDQDVVDITNLHRQILYDAQVLGVPKVEVAQKRLKALNPNIEIDALTFSVNEDTADEAVRGVDLVLDGLDRFAPRFAVNRACRNRGIPYIYAGALETYGNVSTIIPQKTACLECFAGRLSDKELPTCETAGVFPPILATVTSVQVSEAFRLLLGKEPLLANKILFIDLYSLTFSMIDIVRREDCEVCASPSISTSPIKGSLTEFKIGELCGKDSFMVSPKHPLQLNLVDVAEILKKHFKIKLQSNFGIAFEQSDGVTINLMKTGNALIRGLPDKENVRKIYRELLNLIEKTT